MAVEKGNRLQGPIDSRALRGRLGRRGLREAAFMTGGRNDISRHGGKGEELVPVLTEPTEPISKGRLDTILNSKITRIDYLGGLTGMSGLAVQYIIVVTPGVVGLEGKLAPRREEFLCHRNGDVAVMTNIQHLVLTKCHHTFQLQCTP